MIRSAGSFGNPESKTTLSCAIRPVTGRTSIPASPSISASQRSTGIGGSMRPRSAIIASSQRVIALIPTESPRSAAALKAWRCARLTRDGCSVHQERIWVSSRNGASMARVLLTEGFPLRAGVEVDDVTLDLAPPLPASLQRFRAGLARHESCDRASVLGDRQTLALLGDFIQQTETAGLEVTGCD